jgi:hypothetical protein
MLVQMIKLQDVLDWKPYILAAGKCEYMGDPEGTVLQVVHSKWGEQRRHMRDLCFATTVLRGKTVLVVNKKWVPTAKYSVRPFLSNPELV